MRRPWQRATDWQSAQAPACWWREGGREAGGAGLASVDPSPAPGAVPASPAPRPPGSSSPNNGPARAAVRLALADNSRPESSTVTRPTSWQVVAVRRDRERYFGAARALIKNCSASLTYPHARNHHKPSNNANEPKIERKFNSIRTTHKIRDVVRGR